MEFKCVFFFRFLYPSTTAGLRDIFEHKLESVIINGSYARGDYDDESDVDVMTKLLLSADEIRTCRPRVSALVSELGLKYGIMILI